MWLVSLMGLVARARDMLEGGVQKDMAWYEYLYPNSYDTCSSRRRRPRS